MADRAKLAQEMTHWQSTNYDRPYLNMLQLGGLLNVPIASDIAGLLGDLQMYRDRPEERGLLNYAMTGLGALPFVPAVAGRMHAKRGGQIADSNGYFYKGGQFLPNTDAPPGKKFKIGDKVIKSRREPISATEWAQQPTPFSRSIYSLINAYTKKTDSGGLGFAEGIKDNFGKLVLPETAIRPGVAGVLGKEELTVKELIDAYNNGQRWFDVNPSMVSE
jgi:hypothetical protein